MLKIGVMGVGERALLTDCETYAFVAAGYDCYSFYCHDWVWGGMWWMIGYGKVLMSVSIFHWLFV